MTGWLFPLAAYAVALLALAGYWLLLMQRHADLEEDEADLAAVWSDAAEERT